MSRKSGLAGLLTTAVAAVLGVAVLAPAAHAATPSGPVHPLPAGARLATGPLPAVGSHGPAFQAQVSPNGLNPQDYPNVVAIQTRFSDGTDSSGQPVFYDAFCTGTVLDPIDVLTTGSCATDLANGTTLVLAGYSTIGVNPGGGFTSRVNSTWTDPDFDLAALRTGDTGIPEHDDSVLHLTESLPPVYRAAPLATPDATAPYAPGADAEVVGYGLTAGSAGQLEMVDTQIRSDQTCAAAMPGYEQNQMTCLGDQGGTPPGVCTGDSGAPVLNAGTVSGILDWGGTDCPTAGAYAVAVRMSTVSPSITAEVDQPAADNLDWTGDGHTDLMLRTGNGNLVDYSGSGFVNDGSNGFAGHRTIGTGFGQFSTLVRVIGWDGPGIESVLAITPSGAMYDEEGDGSGGFAASQGRLIGTGWTGLSSVVPVFGWISDGHPDLLARTTGGALRLYEGDGYGGWENPAGTQIGTGWNGFDTILSAGDWYSDYHQALIARTPAGALRLYESDGNGGWTNPNGVQIGQGWNGFRTILAPGDWNGDNTPDLIGLTPGGALDLYPTDGHGNWLAATGEQIGQGWQIAAPLF